MSSCHHDTLLVTGHDKSVMVGGSQVWDQVFATGIRSHRERHVQCLEPPATDLETETDTASMLGGKFHFSGSNKEELYLKIHLSFLHRQGATIVQMMFQ